MAELAVRSATDWLGKLLVEEGKYLWGAEGKVEELRDELLWMQSFLRDAETIQHEDEIVRLWIFQIKEYVYEAEDIVDDFIVKIASRRRHKGWINKLRRCSRFMGELVVLHQVASGIDSLKTKISLLSPKLEKYGLKTTYGMKTYRAREALNEQVHQSLKYVHLEDRKIIGLERSAKEVVNALKSSAPDRGVVAIYGMGGLGKSTLATKVFQDDEITKHFRGGRAWAYISKQFEARSVFQTLLADLTSKPTKDFSEKDERELARELHEYLLKNKCLVVLDDVWIQNVWDSLRYAFTTYGGESGSKVLFTTRKEEVAKSADPNALCKPDLLKRDEGWELLQKTIGWIETKGVESHDVSEMIVLGKEMVDHCSGLPLAIVVLGGILRKKETLDEWRLVHKNISSYLRRGYDRGRPYMEVLLQSYNELPYHLKPCFLHLGNFPEDYEICAEKLYWMWMAEGLVTLSSDTVMGTESLEDVANGHLSDLAQAGMIEIVKKEPNGKIKSIRMHDLMRELCLQKAVGENFLSIIDHRLCPDTPLKISAYSSHKRLIRMAVYLAPGVSNFIPDYLSSKAHKYLRSLSFIAGHGVDQDKYQQWMKYICNDFEWLRVLVLEGFHLEGKLTKGIQKLIHLRYLSLKETKISELPSSIGDLVFLQILDLRVSYAVSSVKIPDTLWKLDKLRHLLLPLMPYEVIRHSGVLRVDTLICLETLENLQLSNLQIEDLLKLQNLRRLSIKDMLTEEESLNTLLNSPAIKSGSLQSCSFVVNFSIISNKPSILSNSDCIHHLKLVEVREDISDQTAVIVYPLSLKVLHLESCKLKDDPMRILGRLYHLRVLILDVDSFVGKKLDCESKSFPLLTTLHLRGLINLEVWSLSDGSLSKLKKLRIKNCNKLRRIPDALPSSVQITCTPCVSGIEKYGTCSFSVASHQKQVITHYDHKSLLVLMQPLLSKGYDKVLLWGECGIGKATIAKVIYQHPDVRSHFDAFAWTCLPRECTADLLRRILQGVIRDLDPQKSMEDLSQNDDLVGCLQEVMGTKKCLVVLINMDDLDCGKLDKTFGRECFQGKSKLLMTSNKSLSNTDRVFEENIRHFTAEHRWELFYKILQCRPEIDVLDKDPVMWRNITKHCSGHPLPIAMLGGLLSMKETLREWVDIHKEVTNSDRVESKRIFELCYNELPPHLTSCFLHLATIPEEVEISAKKLYQLWIAAGLVMFKDDEVQADDFLENLAESYLTELVQRGMVRVGKRGPTGKIRTCQLQFGLRDLSSNEQSSHSSLSSSRSRVRDLEGMREEDKEDLLKEVVSLSELRYLSLKRTSVCSLPSSIENLTKLQTLDLRVLESIIIPNVLSKLKSLRHLYLPSNLDAAQPKLELDGLDNLQTLFNLQSDKVDLSNVHELKRLKKISIRKIHSVKEVDSMLKLMGTSVDLSMDSEILNKSLNILSSFQNLHKVRIKGRISGELTSQMFPAHLKELILKHTQLQQDPLPALAKLTELKSLFFDHESFLGKEMTLSKDFLKLTHLTIRSLNNLKHLNCPDEGKHSLESIQITDCWGLDKEGVRIKFRKSRMMME